MIFNGARLGKTCTVALGAKVHIDTELADDTFVPIGFIAYGSPGQLYPPDQAPAVHQELNRLGFARYVFGVDLADRTRTDIMDDVMSRYSRALEAHRDDRVVDDHV